MPLHVAYDLWINQIPQECIEDCSAPGPVDASVQHWREELGFSVNRDRALRCLKGYSAWDDEVLQADSDETLAERILWLACGNFSEYMTCCADNDPPINPFGPEPDDFDPSSGSNVFVLE